MLVDYLKRLNPQYIKHTLTEGVDTPIRNLINLCAKCKMKPLTSKKELNMHLVGTAQKVQRRAHTNSTSSSQNVETDLVPYKEKICCQGKLVVYM